MGNHWLVTSFSRVLEMSITAGVIICMILGIRLCLRKAPKIFSYLLWSVVLFRLLCPVAAESRFSVLGIWQEPAASKARLWSGEMTKDSGKAGKEAVQSSISAETIQVDSYLQENWKTAAGQSKVPNGDGMDTKQQMWTTAAALWIGGVIWILGMTGMAGYGFLSMVRLKKRLAGSLHAEDNVYISDSIDTPFAMGILAPKIYLPGFLSEKEKSYIILHEKTHIRRGDLPVKLLAFAALTVHWFNPLVWIAFLAAEKDMEMSCDEKVMRQMKEDIRAEYSTSLLCLATGKTMIGGAPLAFGEGSTKSRIQNIMQYQKPAAVVIGLAAVLVLGCLVGFGTNPGGQQDVALAVSKAGSKEEEGSGYQKVYSAALSMEEGTVPFEIWTGSDSEKTVNIDGQEIAIDPEFASKVSYEQVEVTGYFDFTGDGNKEIALIDTGQAAGGPFQTIQVFAQTDGQWRELKLPAGLYDTLPEFVTEKLKEENIHMDASGLKCQRTISLSYENEKIRVNDKLFTEDLASAVGTVHKEAVYSPAEKKFVLEEDTRFTPALSGESAYNAYENTYSAELKIGEDTILFEIWAGAVSGNKVIRIGGQEISLAREDASGKYGGIVETEVSDYNGDGTEEIILVDGGGNVNESCLVFGNTGGRWEEIDVSSETEKEIASEFWKKQAEKPDLKTGDSEENRKLREATEAWAKAYCGRDGNTIAAMSTQDVQDSLQKAGLLDTADGVNTFGVSSPWPWREGDFRIVGISGMQAEILYYAQASEPHVCVWRETLEFVQQQDIYMVEKEQLEILDEIQSGEDYRKAYPNGLYGTPMDYVWSGTEQILIQYTMLSSTMLFRDLSDPGKAAVYLLNIKKDAVTVSVGDVQEDGSVLVELAFADGFAATVRMVQAFDVPEDAADVVKDGMTVWVPQDVPGRS